MSGAIAACVNESQWLTLTFTNTNEDLVLPKGLKASSVAIKGSPGLYSLDLSKVDVIGQLNISDAWGLKKISGAPEDGPVVVSLHVQTGQDEYEPVQVAGVALHSVALYDAGYWDFEDLEDLENFDELKVHGQISSVYFENLTSGGILEFEDVPLRNIWIYNLSDVRAAFFSNISGYGQSDDLNYLDVKGLTITTDLTIERSTGFAGFNSIKSVSGNMTVRDMSENPGLTFSGLTTVNNLTVVNNNNVTLDFQLLANVSKIYMASNALTTIPGNMQNLELADEIYLNGEIETYV